MISHKHKFIFIHIPKCGGTSIEHSLLKNENVTKITDDVKQKYRIYYTHGGVDVQHRKIDQFKDVREKDYFTFTFVRNPWERFLSEYFYIIKSENLWHRSQPNRKSGWTKEFQETFPTFKDFVKGDIIGINAIHNDSTSLSLDAFYKINSVNKQRIHPQKILPTKSS